MQDNDLISRSAAIEMCRNLKRYILIEHYTFRHLEAGVHYDELMFGVEHIPALDAAPVIHARWIPGDGEDSDATECYNWECSHCHRQVEYIDPHPFDGLDDYCGKCGARMDAEVV